MRRLRYIMVESGRCQHCRKDAGEHTLDGLCSPQSVPHLRHGDVPEACYRGTLTEAFVDLADDFLRATKRATQRRPVA